MAVEASPVGTKPPAAVGERISKDGRHDLGAVAPPRSKCLSCKGDREVRLHAESDRGLRSILNLVLGSTAIPTHRLYCCSGALRALLSPT